VALWGTFENCPVGGGKLDPCSLILIWDTGASYGLTLFCSDFINYVECDIPVWDVTKVNKVIEIKLCCTNLPTLMVNQSFSHAYPITFHRQMFVFSPLKHIIKCTVFIGYSKVYATSIQMKLHTSTISIMIKQHLTNLPVVQDSFVLNFPVLASIDT
jgi:hypothetical protein